MRHIKLPQSIVTQVVLALLLCVACGLFFGELTAGLQMAGDNMPEDRQPIPEQGAPK